MQVEEIEIPEQYDPEWQIEQLRIIASRLNEIKEMGVSDEAYDQILVIEAHVEAQLSLRRWASNNERR